MNETTVDTGGRAFPTQMGNDDGMFLRDWLAAKTLVGMCMPMEDGSVFPPQFEEGDFVPDPEGNGEDFVWCKFKFSKEWRCVMREDAKPRDGIPHKQVVSYERVIARMAYRYADAMIAEKRRTEVGKDTAK